MTSHAEYIADQDEGQLFHLIKAANNKLSELKLGGWVTLWVVADSSNQGWFQQTDYAGAVAFLDWLAQKRLSDGKECELSLNEISYRKVEADQLVADTQTILIRHRK